MAMVDGSANNPYASTSAISDGNSARKPKKATPALSSGIWSSVVCAQLRLRIWTQPRRGMSWGRSASAPGGCAWASAAGASPTSVADRSDMVHLSCHPKRATH